MVNSKIARIIVLTAVSCLMAMNEQNVKIPEQFSIVGFDGLPISQYTIPPLTTVQQPIYKEENVQQE